MRASGRGDVCASDTRSEVRRRRRQRPPAPPAPPAEVCAPDVGARGTVVVLGRSRCRRVRGRSRFRRVFAMSVVLCATWRLQLACRRQRCRPLTSRGNLVCSARLCVTVRCCRAAAVAAAPFVVMDRGQQLVEVVSCILGRLVAANDRVCSVPGARCSVAPAALPCVPHESPPFLCAHHPVHVPSRVWRRVAVVMSGRWRLRWC